MRLVTTWWVLVSGAVLVGVAVPAAAAPAVPASSAAVHAGDAGDAARDGARTRAVLTLDKNRENPSRSTLTWKVVRHQADGDRRVLEERSWRAGSGMLGRAGRDECAKGRGWLPDGTYRMRFHRDYAGNLIKGRAFRLDDHTCRNGSTRRVQLFIHTEQGARDTQCRDRAGDQVCRWEYPRINDYKSAGCVKLAPGDLAQLSRRYLRYFKAGVRYAKARVVFRVVA